jgi:hypothetical protein
MAMDGLIDVEQRSRLACCGRSSFLEYNIALNAILVKRAGIKSGWTSILFVLECAFDVERCSGKQIHASVGKPKFGMVVVNLFQKTKSFLSSARHHLTTY